MSLDWQELLAASLALLPTAVTFLLISLGVATTRYVLFRGMNTRERRQAMGRQAVVIGLGLIGFVAVILSLPIDQADRRQLLSLVGLLLSGAIALASTSFLGNIMAGLMLRSLRNLRIGDYVEVGDITGRVSERGLFRVEVQAESRDLVTVPNMILATQPVLVGKSDGTIIHTEVSLGYDISRKVVEPLLRSAAEEAGLGEPFVRVIKLGDHSVTYRIAGLLEDVTKRLTASSRLNGNVLDTLHSSGIEIASPTIMNQRPLEREERLIPSEPIRPPDRHGERQEREATADRLAFDKADAAALREQLEMARQDLKKRLLALEDSDESSAAHEAASMRDRIGQIDAALARGADRGEEAG